MANARVLIVPGINGSGPDHWQTRWEEERVDCARIEQENWHDPDPLAWIGRIDAAVSTVSGPVVLVAHSLGCLAVGAWGALSKRARDSRLGAILVAPCDPAQEGAADSIRRFGLIARTAAVPLRPRDQFQRPLCQHHARLALRRRMGQRTHRCRRS